MKGTVYTNARKDDDVTRAVLEAVEAVHGVKVRYRWRPLRWFRRFMR